MRLYHGTSKVIEGGVLPPSPVRQTKNGRDGNWVLATQRVDQAELFSTPWIDNQSRGLLMTATKDPASPLIAFITTDRDRYLNSINGTVYSFPADGFEPVQNKSREFISERPVDLFQECIGRHSITSIDPILERGLQMFFAPRAVAEKFIEDVLIPVTAWDGFDLRCALGQFFHDHRQHMAWENLEREIGVDRMVATFATDHPQTSRWRDPVNQHA